MHKNFQPYVLFNDFQKIKCTKVEKFRKIGNPTSEN